MRDKETAFHPSSQALPLLIFSFLLGTRLGAYLNFQTRNVDEGRGGGGGRWLTSMGVSNQVGPFLNFPPPFFFLRIGLTVEINLTVKKLFKFAIRKMSRTAGLAFCKSRIYNFILPAEKYEKKRPNKQGCMTEAAAFQCFPAVWGYLGYVELMSLLN